MEYLYGKIIVNILVILLMIKDMDMVKCIGMMVISIKDNGKMGNKLGKICMKWKINKFIINR